MKAKTALLLCGLVVASTFTSATGRNEENAAIAVAPNLVAEGIPPIPLSIASEARRFTEFRSAFLADWHPTRREMLIRTRFGETQQIHYVKQPLGARRQITFFQDAVDAGVFAPGEERAFFFTKDVGGDEFDQIFRYDLETGTIDLLSDGKSKNSRPLFSRDGKRFVHTSTRRNGKDWDFYAADVASPADAKLVFEADGPGWVPTDWSPDGKSLIALKMISANESIMWLVDVATGEKKRISPQSPTRSVFHAGKFSPDGKHIYTATNDGSEFLRLILLDPASGKFETLTPDLNWDVEEFELSEDGKYLAYVVNEDGMSVLHVMETESRKAIGVPKLPPGQIKGVTFHRNGRDLGFRLDSAKAPGDVYSIDVTTGELTRWTESETAGLNTQLFPDPQLVRWTSFDGRAISGFLFKPDATQFPGKRPVIINIHGGPASQFRPGFMGAYNYYITRLGCAAIFPNVRGSEGYGKTFLELDDGRKREDSVKDIGALLDWIKTQEDLDADRIMVTGGSYGGYMSLAVAMKYADRIRCSADVVGISNFVSFLENTEPYRQDLRRSEYGDERDPEMRKFLEEVSPLNQVEKIRKPMFIIHGVNDPRVPVSEAHQIAEALRKQGTPVWMLLAKDEGHGFSKKPNQQFQFYATIMYIQRHLLN